MYSRSENINLPSPFKIPRPSYNIYRGEDGDKQRWDEAHGITNATYEDVTNKPGIDMKSYQEAISERESSDNSELTAVGQLKRQYHWLRIVNIFLIVLLTSLVLGFSIYLGVHVAPSARSSHDVQQNVKKIDRQVEKTKETVESIETRLNKTSVCVNNPCVHGQCQNDGESFVCVCEEDYSGERCEKRMTIKFDGLNLNISTEAAANYLYSTSPLWSLVYREKGDFISTKEIYTQDENVTITGLKRLTLYMVTIFAIDWQLNHVQTDQKTVKLMRHEFDATLQLKKEDTPAENGYLVLVERITGGKPGVKKFRPGEGPVILDALDPCTEYIIDIRRPSTTLGEVVVNTRELRTVCEELGWTLGDSIEHREWSGGATELLSTFCNQPDEFPFTIRNHQCTGNRVGQAISNQSSHSGHMSFHFKRGNHPDMRGSGLIYSPQLRYKAGRSDGNHTADADGFYIRFWVKAASPVDDNSIIMVEGADDRGDDRASAILRIQSSSVNNNTIQFITYEHKGNGTECRVWRNCTHYGFKTVSLQDSLNRSQWIKVEMTFHSYPGDYNDKWSWNINGGLNITTDSYLQAWHFERGDHRPAPVYRYINRIRISARHKEMDARFQGFLFDDVYYKVFKWSDPEKILDEYYTSFEH